MGKMNFLIVNPNISECRAMLAYCLRDERLHVLPCVYNGVSAMEILSQNIVDILVLDTAVPSPYGAFDILDEMERLEIKPPIIFVTTTLSDDTLLLKLQERGVVYCFVKPVEWHVTYSTILHYSNLLPGSPEERRHYLRGLLPLQKKQKEEITRQIRLIGVPAHLKGYHYLRSAILIMVNENEPSNVAVTKVIYPAVAEEFNTKPTLVERSIRNAIEVTWTRGNTDLLYDYFGYTIDDDKGKPTNSEFISMISDRVRMLLTQLG